MNVGIIIKYQYIDNINIDDYFYIINAIGVLWIKMEKIKISIHTVMTTLIILGQYFKK